jgi:Ca2+-binding EF-hand superfamily protein
MANPRRKMIELFKDIDKDLNGKIEYSEFKCFLTRAGCTNEEIEELIRLGDLNKDNVIDLNEFLTRFEEDTSQ